MRQVVDRDFNEFPATTHYTLRSTIEEGLVFACVIEGAPYGEARIVSEIRGRTWSLARRRHIPRAQELLQMGILARFEEIPYLLQFLAQLSVL